MKKIGFKPPFALLLILCIVLPIMIVGASASDAVYPETADWLDVNPNANQDYAYSIAVVGDTQILVDHDVTNGTAITGEIYDWIVANKDAKKMQYVFGLGDITEHDTDAEWEHAKSFITTMNGEIPYLLVRGGLPHDSQEQFDKYFAGETAYTSSLTGVYEEGSIANSYTAFTAGSVNYLVFALDFAAHDEVLEWAGNIIELPQYEDYRVIITTHSYLYSDGTTIDQNENSTAIPDKSDRTSDDANNNGDEMWDKFVRKHENIFLILSGHMSSDDIVASQAIGDNGNVVTQMLIDPQDFDYKQGCETGMVCMLYFSEDGNTMSVEWYSTVRNQYFRESNQFDINLIEASLNDGVATEYGLIPERYYNPDEFPFALFKKTPSVYNGESYDYTLLGVYKTLVGDSSLSATAGDDIAFHAARMSAGDGAVILMLRDVVNTDTLSYTNLQYHTGGLTLDLGGHTMTDSHTYTTPLFYSYMKSNNNHTVLTVKNGGIVVGNQGLVGFGAFADRTNCSMSIDFEDVNISYKEGSTASYLVAKYAPGSEYSGCFPVNFDGCVIDMKNAPDGALIVQSGSGETVTVTGTNIINSDYTYNINEYGYSATKPAEDEPFAIYMKSGNNTVLIDGVTYPSEYELYGYAKSLNEHKDLGVTTVGSAFGMVREASNRGYEVTLALLKDHTDTSTSNYSNLCYNKTDSVFDLRGYTLTDKHTHTAQLFYVYLKAATANSSTFTVKNGEIALYTSGLTNYTVANYNYYFKMVFEDVRFSYVEGTPTSAFIGSTTNRDLLPMEFKDCVIDLANARSTVTLSGNASFDGISFENTKVINSSDTDVNTSSTDDIYDGNYIITSYGIIPLSVADEQTYPFAAFSKANITIDGVTYAYKFYGAYQTLTGDSKIGATDDSALGFSALRYAGDGAVLLMRRDFVDYADKNYTNFAYNRGTVTLDLGGFTLTDNHTHTATLFYNYIKKNGYNSVFVVKNGSILLGKSGLTNYTLTSGVTTSTMTTRFEDVYIGFQEGAAATNIVGRCTYAPGIFGIEFVGCVVDLKNAIPTLDFVITGAGVDSLPIKLTDTEIINSNVIIPKANLTLHNNFLLNVYIPVSASNSNVKIVSVEFGGAEHLISELETVKIDGVDYYKLSVPVAPNMAMDNKTVVVNVSHTFTYSNGTTKVTDSYLEWDISVVSYLKALADSSETVVKTLAKDMLSYIRAAYVYDGSSDKLAEVKDLVDSINGADYDNGSVPSDLEAKRIVDGMHSAQLLLTSAPAFIFYPEVDADGELVYNVEDYVFALDGKYRLNTVVAVNEEGRTYIQVSLPAYAADNTVEYIINGTGIHGYYNIKAYYDSVSDENDEALISLVERLWKYAESAEAYMNSLN